MPTSYILIDYENVQPELMSLLGQDHLKLIVFVGASQTKVAFSTAEALQRLGSRAEYVKITGNGSNALDFHIAYYIGRLASEEPAGHFLVVSKDAGFDPLIQHLKDKGIAATRAREVSDIAAVKATAPKAPAQRIELVIAKLRQLKATKPRTVKTLTSTINALFQKQLVDGEATGLIKELQTRGFISVTGSKISYSLPN